MKHFNLFFISIIIFIILLCFISIVSIYYTEASSNFNNSTTTNYYFSNSDFFWPTPGYHTITSYFGKRVSPTTGASSNHSGIDIAASEGASVFSVLSGEVTFVGFSGANGHSIIIKNDIFSIQYSHLSPNYIVNIRRFYY